MQRLTEVDLAAWNPDTSTMATTPVAAWDYDTDGRLAHAPAYVTRERGGSGFHEVVECLLVSRNPA